MYLFYTESERELNRAESRRLLGATLRQWIAITGSNISSDEAMESLALGDTGKPYFELEGAPHFSVSHSGRAWAVLICDKPVGLDIQYEVPAKYDLIARKYYTREEADRIARLDGVTKSHEFFRIWSRREAIVKAVGSTVFSDEQGILKEYDLAVREIELPLDLHCAAACLQDEEIHIHRLQEA